MFVGKFCASSIVFNSYELVTIKNAASVSVCIVGVVPVIRLSTLSTVLPFTTMKFPVNVLPFAAI